MPRLISPQETFEYGYDITYPFDGYDVLTQTVNGKPGYIPVSYTTHPLTRATSFLGIPNRVRDDEHHEQSVLNIVKNFVGWPEYNAPTWKKVLSYIFMPFMLLMNVLLIPFKLSLNIVKLVTEFLPLSLAQLVYHKVSKMDDSFAKSALRVFGDLLTGVHFVGAAITSPIQNVRRAFIKNKGVKAILATALSIVVSVVAYSFIVPFVWPYVAQFVTSTVVPFLAANLPAAIVHAATVVINAVGPIVSTVMTALGNALTPVFAPLFQLLGLSSLSAGVASIAALTTLAATTVGVVISAVVDAVVNWLHNVRTKKSVSFQMDTASAEMDTDHKHDHSATFEKSAPSPKPGTTATLFEKMDDGSIPKGVAKGMAAPSTPPDSSESSEKEDAAVMPTLPSAPPATEDKAASAAPAATAAPAAPTAPAAPEVEVKPSM